MFAHFNLFSYERSYDCKWFIILAAKKFYNIGHSLAEITAPAEERRNATTLYNPTTLDEMPHLVCLSAPRHSA